jgi:hypothetical protein
MLFRVMTTVRQILQVLFELLFVHPTRSRCTVIADERESPK